ncbi:MAG TPA: serine/threonine-protein kinase [Haliangium sp.]|nr:serine/threonine-protein kinase [Haliangium sp.]
MSDNGSLDRYIVLEYLSEGGMGAIFLGKKLGAGGFEKPVVLKQLLPEFTSQAEFIDLFLREARLSATLDHANIIHTIDLVTAGSEHFIVMEYLAGGDLRTLVQKAKRRRKRFSPAAAIYIAREVLSALAYAHAKLGPDGQPLALIHRDVSPSNILISHNGEVKLTDFGIAKAATHNSIFYRVKGKIGYMSPEQARSEDLDHRSDLYSLAVCLYEVLTGERLFVHAGLTTSADEIYSQPVPAVSQKLSGVPAAFDQVLFRALAIDPNQRFQTAGAFQEALLRVAHQAGLMMSAPELAAHLADVCGEPSQWRDLEREEDLPYEDYAEGTERIQLDEMEEDQRRQDQDEGPRGPQLDERAAREPRAPTSMTDLERFRGLELTSMIRIGEMAQGAQPLVDVDEFGNMPLAEMSDSAMPLADDTVGFRPRNIDFGQQQSAPPAARSRPAAPIAAVRPVLTPTPLRAVSVRPEQPSARSWPIWLLIFLAGLGTAAAVGLTGPRLRYSEALTSPASAPPAASTAPAAVAPSGASAAPAAGSQSADRAQ